MQNMYSIYHITESTLQRPVGLKLHDDPQIFVAFFVKLRTGLKKIYSFNTIEKHGQNGLRESQRV